MSLLRLRGVHRYYGAEHILGPLDLEVHQADRIGLIGPNGSGKSTLLDILAGKEPDEGEVFRAGGFASGTCARRCPAVMSLPCWTTPSPPFDIWTRWKRALEPWKSRWPIPPCKATAEALQATVSHYQRLMTRGWSKREACKRSPGLGRSCLAWGLPPKSWISRSVVYPAGRGPGPAGPCALGRSRHPSVG